jgi:hypothetical protein
MKPFLYFYLILILFQTLISGNLVKIELPHTYKERWKETGISQQVVLDPFLMPGKEGIEQNVQARNQWLSYHFIKTFLIRNTTVLPQLVSESQFIPEIQYNYKTNPVYILNGTLLI